MKPSVVVLSSLLILAASPLSATAVSPVPEPTTLGLVGAAAVAGALLAKKLRQIRHK